jgi:hypothetical protein
MRSRSEKLLSRTQFHQRFWMAIQRWSAASLSRSFSTEVGRGVAKWMEAANGGLRNYAGYSLLFSATTRHFSGTRV